jgi:hypothetical protein
MSDKKAPPKPAAAPAAPQQPPKPPPKWLLTIKKIISIIGVILKAIFKNPVVTGTINAIGKLGMLGWLKIFTCITLGLLSYTVYKTAPSWKRFWKLPFSATLLDVADRRETFGNDVDVIRYNNDLLAQQFVVQISKIVVNLVPGERSTRNPMVAFDLYVRTDTEEASVEIRKREKELQDHLQRFCEGLNYDQILNEEGKRVWKLKMKRELNLVLNTGQVKDVFFKTLLLKP